MLCEGFYLHTVLVSAFISEQRLVRWLMAFGWIAPAIILFSYGFIRGAYGTETHNMQWVINIRYFFVIFNFKLYAVNWPFQCHEQWTTINIIIIICNLISIWFLLNFNICPNWITVTDTHAPLTLSDFIQLLKLLYQDFYYWFTQYTIYSKHKQFALVVLDFIWNFKNYANDYLMERMMKTWHTHTANTIVTPVKSN